jgi:hypothetical protein
MTSAVKYHGHGGMGPVVPDFVDVAVIDTTRVSWMGGYPGARASW